MCPRLFLKMSYFATKKRLIGLWFLTSLFHLAIYAEMVQKSCACIAATGKPSKFLQTVCDLMNVPIISHPNLSQCASMREDRQTELDIGFSIAF